MITVKTTMMTKDQASAEAYPILKNRKALR